MTKQELQAQANELQKQLNTLTEKIANCKDEPKMFPQERDAYWYFNNMDGRVHSNIAMNSNGRLNVFKTEAEAQRAADIQWAKQRVAHRIAVLNEGWKPDWNDPLQAKYFIEFNYTSTTSNFSVDYIATIKIQPDWMHCKSEEVAKQIIEECREDLLLIFSE